AGAATLLVSMAVGLLNAVVATGIDPKLIAADPMRLVQAVVTGISFLGAGTIFRSRRGEPVEGLTTAATILLSGVIGVSVAVRQWLVAVGVTLLTLVVLRGLKWVEDRLHR